MKKTRKETLLLKYGLIAFLEIAACICVFVTITAYMTKKPVEEVYREAVENIMEESISNATTWFEGHVSQLKVFQNSVVNERENYENIKKQIKIKKTPTGFEYVMVFWDEATKAKDGGPETYNTKGGISTAGILDKEYWRMHRSQDVELWLESPRKANAGGTTIPIFVRSNFIDDRTGKEVRGGMVGFLDLEPIHVLGRTFYKTGNISIYDDKSEIRAGKDVLNLDDTSHLIMWERSFRLANKHWKIVASLEKSELGEISNTLRLNSIKGGFFVALFLVILELLIIKAIIGKFDSIKKNIDNLNTGDKDLTKRLEILHNNEISQVKRSVNQFVETVHGTVRKIGDANIELKQTFGNVKQHLEESSQRIDEISEQIGLARENLERNDGCVMNTSSSVTQISENITNLNELIKSQVQAISEASSSVEQMAGSILSVSDSVGKMSLEFAELNDATLEGITKNDLVNELLDSILRQSRTLQETNTIIQDIASQTNLLSMNAMIESAHAGEAGKGFAVVAEEIGKLADTSGMQSKSISENLKEISENIEKVVESSNSSKISFERVSEKASCTSDLVENIRNAMQEQSVGSKQLLSVIASMNSISQNVLESSREIETRTEEILGSMKSLKESSENMSSSFSKIVSTTAKTKKNTEDISLLTDEMSHAVENISARIDEFKV